jgi:hypothetical protein
MKTKIKPLKKRNPLALDLPPDLRKRLQVIAEKNEMNLSVIARMCLTTGMGLVEQKLDEMRQPAMAA